MRLSLVLAVLLGGCGAETSTGDGRAVLRALRPIGTAQVHAKTRIAFDHAPADVGSPLLLRFDGPLRSNGADKLPSLDWNISFTGLGSTFKSRVVSTGSNLFVRLGGVDFAVGEDAVARMVDQARQAQTAGQSGLGAIGVDPVAAIAALKPLGPATVAGAKVTRYAGTVDRDKLMDQVQRLLRGLPATPGTPAELTADQRTKLKTMFGTPRFELDVAADHTVRRLHVQLRFTTPVANRPAAGGITGGTIDYGVEYSALPSAPRIAPPPDPQPINDFLTALTHELSR